MQDIALKKYEPAVQMLHSKVCSSVVAFQIGDNFYNAANGFAKSYDSALKWYEKAAQQGNVAAVINVGYMYQHGQGVPSCDVAKALYWFNLAIQTADMQQLASVKALVNGDKLVEWISQYQIGMNNC